MRWLETAGGRKFILAVMALLSATFLAYVKAIDGTAYASVMVLCVAAFISGNVVQKKNAPQQQSGEVHTPQ